MTQVGRRDVVAARVKHVLSQYGKCGLLVDDEQAAMRRTARELYGAEVLPEWWLVLQSCECAALAVDTLLSSQHVSVEQRPQYEPAILVLDRRLPKTCVPSAPIVAWDRGDSSRQGPEARALVAEIRRWVQAERENPHLLWQVYQTSYPFGGDLHSHSHAATSSGLPWMARNSNVLHRLRQNLCANWERPGARLLRYGPSPIPKRSYPVSEEHRYLRDRWTVTIDALANRLAVKRAGSVILLTGAGASLAPHSYAAGMPPTPKLLRAAYELWERSVGGQIEASTDHMLPPYKIRCACANSGKGSEPRTSEKITIRDFEHFRELMKDNVDLEHLSWEMQSLFKAGQGETDLFADSLRLSMLRFDRGIPYQHSLLSGLAWDTIVTTNFDTFHERAWENRGARAPLLQQAWKDKLLKAHGTLNDDSPLVLTEAQLDKNQRELIGTLNKKIRQQEPGVLVVVGHSMRDSYLGEFFASKERALTKWLVCWCDPDAFKRVADGVKLDGWGRLIRKARDDRDGRTFAVGSGPLPARAIDLAYDLATAVFQRPQRHPTPS